MADKINDNNLTGGRNEFSEKYREILGNRSYSIDNIGMSKAQVICFDDMVLKIEKQSEESEKEYNMMKWLSGKLPVPKVICLENEEGMNYLLMTRVEGEMSCSPEFMKNARHLVKILAEGLRRLWNVDISNCPYSNSLDDMLKRAEFRVCNNLCSVEDAEPETYGVNGFAGPKELLHWLKENKPTEEPVLSHGDYCLPNIFIKDNKISGYIDLGRSGIADKYQDIALCYRSLIHNFKGSCGGKVFEGFDAKILFEELDIAPHWDKIKYYILLDELF